MRGRLALVASVCLGGTLVAPAAAPANHLHSLQTGNGSCAVLAQQGGEPAVTLPDASYNNTSLLPGSGNPHPLHVHVHRGEPGSNGGIAVLGTIADPCAVDGGYLNYEP